MKLTLSPIAGLPGEPETTASVAGDVLTVDGIAYDLTTIPEGADATPKGENHPFAGVIQRIDGEIHAVIRWQYGNNAEPDQPTDPDYWSVTVASGDVPSLIVKKSETENA